MAINKPDPPEAATKAATSSLASLSRARGGDDAEDGGGLGNGGNSLPIYHVDGTLLNIEGSPFEANPKVANPADSLANARAVGWQYLVGTAPHIKCIEVIDDHTAAVDHGPMATGISRALDVAASETPDGLFEARMLTFGRVENPVLWLHGEESGGERFFSLGSDAAEVDPALVLGRAAQSALIRQKGELERANDDDDESGG